MTYKLSNLAAFISDNAAVMVGGNDSVLLRLRTVNLSSVNIGCLYHLADLCGKSRLKALSAQSTC